MAVDIHDMVVDTHAMAEDPIMVGDITNAWPLV